MQETLLNACRKGHTPVVESLLKARIDPNLPTKVLFKNFYKHNVFNILFVNS